MIYKYLSPERYDFFDSLKLRFSQPEALNDPYECEPAFIGNTKEYIDNILQSDENTSNEEENAQPRNTKKKNAKMYENDPIALYNLIKEKTQQSINNRIGILSLSKKNNNCVMWAHYTKNHRGFVIGFNETHRFFHLQDDDYNDVGEITSVIYSSVRYVLNIN